ncbi:MAG: SDR family NAD(P)-dependent oxidoreductase [Hydrotalea sp.]|nr:SDR family NAD(P)-dependent oxidoreductase [Hydrotalea sp.]
MLKQKANNNFNDKIALVIGASRGIGRAVAVQLALQGATVLAVARTQGALTELDDEVRQKTNGKNHIAIITADITKDDTIALLFANILKRFGRVDIMVGAAARLGDLTPLAHLEEKDFDKTIALNLTAYHRLIRYGEPLLNQSPSGRVVFFTSGVTKNYPAFWGGYSISKAGVEAMVRTWGGELQKTNITANAINPGATRTAMRAAAFPGEDATTLKTAEAVALFTLPFLQDNNKLQGQIIDYKK